MNKIKYTAEENAKGMSTLNGMPMTLTHPSDEEGRNVSVFSPSGIDFYSGGKITNTYNKDGVWYANSDIDEKKLRASEQGEYFANRLDDNLPIGVSTGLTFEANNESGEGYDMIARNMEFDHLAMLHESEKPAGGDATVMRFNGEDVQAFNFDDIKPAEPESTESIITRALNAFAKKFSMGYNNTDLNTNDEECAMRDIIEAKLAAKQIEVNGLDDGAKLEKYNEIVLAEKQDALQANSTETPAWASALAAKVESLESQLTANADKELSEVAEQVAALNKGLDAEDAKALGLTKAKAFLAANSAEYVADYAAPRGRASQVNANKADAEKWASIDLNAGLGE